jgi:hypothetical protein
MRQPNALETPAPALPYAGPPNSQRELPPAVRVANSVELSDRSPTPDELINKLDEVYRGMVREAWEEAELAAQHESPHQLLERARVSPPMASKASALATIVGKSRRSETLTDEERGLAEDRIAELQSSRTDTQSRAERTRAVAYQTAREVEDGERRAADIVKAEQYDEAEDEEERLRAPISNLRGAAQAEVDEVEARFDTRINNILGEAQTKYEEGLADAHADASRMGAANKLRQLRELAEQLQAGSIRAEAINGRKQKKVDEIRSALEEKIAEIEKAAQEAGDAIRRQADIDHREAIAAAREKRQTAEKEADIDAQRKVGLVDLEVTILTGVLAQKSGIKSPIPVPRSSKQRQSKTTTSSRTKEGAVSPLPADMSRPAVTRGSVVPEPERPAEKVRPERKITAWNVAGAGVVIFAEDAYKFLKRQFQQRHKGEMDPQAASEPAVVTEQNGRKKIYRRAATVALTIGVGLPALAIATGESTEDQPENALYAVAAYDDYLNRLINDESIVIATNDGRQFNLMNGDGVVGDVYTEDTESGKKGEEIRADHDYRNLVNAYIAVTSFGNPDHPNGVAPVPPDVAERMASEMGLDGVDLSNPENSLAVFMRYANYKSVEALSAQIAEEDFYRQFAQVSGLFPADENDPEQVAARDQRIELFVQLAVEWRDGLTSSEALNEALRSVEGWQDAYNQAVQAVRGRELLSEEEIELVSGSEG